MATLAGFSTACSTAPMAIPAASAGDALLASLQVTPAGDSVAFLMQVTNTLERTVRLEFSSSQIADFVVTRGGNEIWRWSSEHAFAQALRSETLPPGGTIRAEATWAVPTGMTGQLQATGRFLAQGTAVQQTTIFALP